MKGLEAPLIAGMPAWYVERQLQKFREGIRGTHPRDMPGMRMRPMANTLKESDVAAVAAYVESLPIQASVPTLEGADKEKGKAGFAICAACHGPDAKGNQQLSAPMLAGQDDWYLVTQIKNFKADIRGYDPRDVQAALMKPMVASLDEVAMKDLAAYLQSLSRK
jgi:cytochrome c553